MKNTKNTKQETVKKNANEKKLLTRHKVIKTQDNKEHNRKNENTKTKI